MKVRVGQTDIIIDRGDITEYEVDAIVNAANSDLAMGAGVAGAIKRKGGTIIEEDAARQGPVEVGDAVVTTAGNLPAGYVIHVEAMDSDSLTLNQFSQHNVSALQPNNLSSGAYGVQLLQSYWFIKSDHLGKVGVGLQSSASDNAAILVDGSGSLVPANWVMFDYNGFLARNSAGGVSALNWQTLGGFCFGGGGAGGSWGQTVSTITSTKTSVSTIRPVKSSGSSGFSFDLDLDDGWWVLLAIVALLGAAIAALYVVYIAPALLAEILLDGVLLAGLYERVKSIEHQHWLRSALRRTAVPAVIIVVFFAIAGYAMQRAAPEAHSIGEVWKHITDR